jgi:hypothetical protein
MKFGGTSWLLDDIREFGGSALDMLGDEASAAWVEGAAIEAFGGPRWFDAAGAPSADHFIEMVPVDARRRIADGSATLLFDMSNEGPIFQADWMAVFHRSLREYGLPVERCVILQQNRCFEASYRTWAAAHGVIPVRILIYDHFPRRMVGLLATKELILDISTELRDKMFMCLNFTPRSPRIGFVSWLLAGGFDRLGYVSFSSLGASKEDLGEPTLPHWFPEIETVRRGLELLKERVPMVVDLDPASRDVPEYSLGSAAAYSQSYFSIVTESDISDGQVVRITEKSIKPLAMMHPLIIVGNPHSLQMLREFGFKTFSDIFDESYDDIEDPTLRIATVMAEVARVLAMPLPQLHDAYQRIRHILLHNALVARRHMDDQYCYVQQPAILRAISGG